MKITIAKNYAIERTYIVNILFKQFLGLNYTLEIAESAAHPYQITWENKQLLFTSDFFPKSEQESYLSPEYLPQISHYQEKNFDTIVLYGKPNIVWSDSEITCGIDLFGSAFFMLSRWEEYVEKTRDAHGRFPASVSIAYQNNFLHRPIVNEYVELLWKMLQHLGILQKRKAWQFKIIPTHDVDLPRLWWNVKDKARSLAGSLLKRRSLKEFSTLTNSVIKNKDPFDTFDYLMSESEKNGLQSHFFFMSGGTSEKDNHYIISHPEIQNLIQSIHERGHYIGFHPSYNAYNNSEQFGKELDTLQLVSPQPITSGRQHFLCFEVPTTWQIWEQYGMAWESSMTYPEQVGFRCGVCYPFPVFDVLERKALQLIERPLIAMEVSLVQYQKASVDESNLQLQQLKNTVQQYNGELVLLWHNSSLNLQWAQYRGTYEAAIQMNV